VVNLPDPVSILLVDDREENLVALRATLDALHCRLVSVTSGEAALAALKNEEFAVILLDMMMPGIDGIETANRIKSGAVANHVPILFLTAADMPSGSVKAYGAGAVDFIQKPYDPFIVRSKVAVFVELYRRGKQLRDHEERRIREQVARERVEIERANLERLLMDAPAAIAIFGGDDHVYEFVNATYRRLLGDRDVVGRVVAEAFPEAASSIMLSLQEVRVSGKRSTQQEVPVTAHWDGSALDEQRFFNFSYEPWRNAAGELLGILSFGFDVTEQVRARKTVETLAEERERALCVRDEFLAIASHELKTPLTPLKLHLQSLKRTVESGREPTQVGNKLDVALRQVLRLENLVHTLLDISRLSSGALRLECENVDLNEVIRDSVDRFQIEAERSNTAIELAASDAIVGWWDRLRLDHVVSNLLSNALKFGRGKPVHVSVAKTGRAVVLEVRDHGIGICAADRERIFARFERAVSRRQYGGFGVGLWIAREVVEAMGGNIEVLSEPGEGALFRVTLPRTDTAPVAALIDR
jgi:signal transduction histidine kinase